AHATGHHTVARWSSSQQFQWLPLGGPLAVPFQRTAHPPELSCSSEMFGPFLGPSPLSQLGSFCWRCSQAPVALVRRLAIRFQRKRSALGVATASVRPDAAKPAAPARRTVAAAARRPLARR